MAEPISPEQRAKLAIDEIFAEGGGTYDPTFGGKKPKDIIASAIRAAETAAVDRCAKEADSRIIAHLPTVFSERNEVCREISAAIRKLPD